MRTNVTNVEDGGSREALPRRRQPKRGIESLARKHVAIVEGENDQDGVPHSIPSSIPNCMLSYAGIRLAVM